MPYKDRKYVGAFARLSADAIKRSEQMMLIATENIGHDFKIEDPKVAEHPPGWTWEEFISAMERATAEGRGAEFDAMLAGILGPMIDKVLSGQAGGNRGQ